MQKQNDVTSQSVLPYFEVVVELHDGVLPHDLLDLFALLFVEAAEVDCDGVLERADVLVQPLAHLRLEIRDIKTSSF